jgi:hypothetical protein
MAPLLILIATARSLRSDTEEEEEEEEEEIVVYWYLIQ